MSTAAKPKREVSDWGKLAGIQIRHREGDKQTIVQASSRGRPGIWHNLDLEAYNLNGRCDCEHFQFTLEPKVRSVNPATGQLKRYRCDHLKVAREWLLDTFLVAIKTVGRDNGGY